MFIGTNSGEEKAGLQRNPHIFNVLMLHHLTETSITIANEDEER
jgi:hypothetical protein